MSNKSLKKSPEQIQMEKDEKYLLGTPTRMEVSNYVNALIEEKFAPSILNSMQLGFMTLQAILIKKEICTEDEIREITEEFIRIQSNKSSEDSSKT